MDKPSRYQNAINQIAYSLCKHSPKLNPVASMAIIASAVKVNFPEAVFVGFYIVQTDMQVLEVGPYQGRLLACGRIAFGDGACGTAACRQQTVILHDVSQSINYIACDDETQSEIVVPIFIEGKLIGVLDIDSDEIAGFDEIDK